MSTIKQSSSHQIFEQALENHLSGQFQDAEQKYRLAINRNFYFFEAHQHLGLLYFQQNSFDQALNYFQQAFVIKPDDGQVLNNLGMTFMNLGLSDRAYACLKKAIPFAEQFPDIHYNLGVLKFGQKKIEQAVHHFTNAIKAHPHHVNAHKNLAFILKEMGETEHADTVYEQVLRFYFDPGIMVKKNMLLPVIPESMNQIIMLRQRIWNFIKKMPTDIQIQDPYQEIGSTLFYLSYHGLDNKDLQYQVANFYQSICPNLSYTAPHIDHKSNHTKPRIGIISCYFSKHTIGKVNHGLIHNLSRKQFDIILFQASNSQESYLSQKYSLPVVSLPLDLKSCQEKISAYQLDLLFYLDIGMEPLTYFLAFSRLAKVQCVSWGHPETTGIKTIDYYISSEYIEGSDAKNHYTEKLICLKNFITCFQRPQKTVKTIKPNMLNLPKNGRFYVCPQSLVKVHPYFDYILSKILQKDPKAHIIFFNAKYEHWTRLLKNRFQKRIPQGHDRIIFIQRMPLENLLSFLQNVDVVLDIPQFSSGTTTLELFSAGIPVVTLPGPFMRMQLASGCYKRMKLNTGIVQSPDEYVDISLKIANDHQYRKQMVQAIEEQSPLLFNDMKYVHEMEEIFRKLIFFNK
ncbi:hypothetical protein MHK_000812 [Candidatus Magnetomorum sp. HK-1]|nr:hypothetical protein MHK_000812 [Candidatus Magnetomorum sp. HK-1]